MYNSFEIAKFSKKHDQYENERTPGRNFYVLHLMKNVGKTVQRTKLLTITLGNWTYSIKVKNLNPKKIIFQKFGFKQNSFAP